MPERNIFSGKNMRAVSALVIVVIIVIAVVVVGVGVYAATRGSSKPSSSTTPTPTAATTSSPSSTTTPKSSSTRRIATATSYEFNETGTAPNGTVLDMLYYATKNLGTSNVDLIEVATSPSSGTLEYIINGGQQKAWFYQNGQWTDISTEFSDILPTIESTAGLYTNMLEGWGGSGSFKYTIPNGQPNAGDTASFTNIQINPSLPDSLFVGPTS